jgi:hypothetical protein
MDQLKVILRQCVKYRFWIAVGISLLLPLIGYFVGAGTINAETTKREGEIKQAKEGVSKYTSGVVVNHQYQPEAAKKKEVLVQDVDETWRKLFASQEPLLKWPVEVQERFRKWGRKYPEDVDRNQVQTTLIDYAVAYPSFVENIYKIFKPFNYEDGTGIVVAPDAKVLLAQSEFSQDAPPDMTKVWSEQERLWVVTALLDVVAKVNDGVGAKDWEGAVVKQINLLEVGSPLDQDQESMAKGETLLPPDSLMPAGGAAPAAPPTVPSAPGGGESRPGMGGGMGGPANAPSNEVYYIKTDSQQFKTLPIRMSVLVDQARLQNFLVGLENSPMAIVVSEVEFAKPLAAVSKPAIGEKTSFAMGGSRMGSGGRADEMMMGSGGAAARAMAGSMGRRAPGPGMGGGAEAGMAGRGGMGAPGASTKGGVDNRGKNDAKARADREKKEKDAANKKDEKKIDQYYNVIEVTVYGRARFYLAPPAPPQTQPSTASAPPVAPPTPAPDAPKAAATEAPKPETPAAEATKKDEAPKAEAAAPKGDEPKADAPKADAPKSEAPKSEAPKGDAAPKL